jgi:hypothetical protein
MDSMDQHGVTRAMLSTVWQARGGKQPTLDLGDRGHQLHRPRPVHRVSIGRLGIGGTSFDYTDDRLSTRSRCI